jgi:hypothetical protein
MGILKGRPIRKTAHTFSGPVLESRRPKRASLAVSRGLRLGLGTDREMETTA